MKNQNIFIYNDTFTSLLNLVKILMKKRIIPFNIKSTNYSPNLLDKIINIEVTDDESIIKEIIDKVGNKIFNTIYYIFLSNDENKEIIIYYFLAHSLKYKNKIFYMRNLKSVNKALQISKYVSHECHKFKGFLRFKELENKILYAEIAPESDITFLLSKHFKERLKNEYWIIKDTKRGIISLYDKNNFYITDDKNFTLLTTKLSSKELTIEDMWKSFYKTIGIEERKNDRCRMNFMPKKYWKYIIEMSDELEKSN